MTWSTLLCISAAVFRPGQEAMRGTKAPWMDNGACVYCRDPALSAADKAASHILLLNFKHASIALTPAVSASRMTVLSTAQCTCRDSRCTCVRCCVLQGRYGSDCTISQVLALVLYIAQAGPATRPFCLAPLSLPAAAADLADLELATAAANLAARVAALAVDLAAAAAAVVLTADAADLAAGLAGVAIVFAAGVADLAADLAAGAVPVVLAADDADLVVRRHRFSRRLRCRSRRRSRRCCRRFTFSPSPPQISLLSCRLSPPCLPPSACQKAQF